jgi:succinate--hydroxymethylglutarate CoA-transferase
MLLADLGAEVIKIEHPTRGDDTRAWHPPSAPTIEQPLTPPSTPGATETTGELTSDWSTLPPESAYFLSVNRGKRSVGVNLKDPRGLKIVRDMISEADILVRPPPGIRTGAWIAMNRSKMCVADVGGCSRPHALQYVPGKLDELGLGYEGACDMSLARLARRPAAECNKLNPKLIYASITGARPRSRTGPWLTMHRVRTDGAIPASFRVRIGPAVYA